MKKKMKRNFIFGIKWWKIEKEEAEEAKIQTGRRIWLICQTCFRTKNDFLPACCSLLSTSYSQYLISTRMIENIFFCSFFFFDVFFLFLFPSQPNAFFFFYVYVYSSSINTILVFKVVCKCISCIYIEKNIRFLILITLWGKCKCSIDLTFTSLFHSFPRKMGIDSVKWKVN